MRACVVAWNSALPAALVQHPLRRYLQGSTYACLAFIEWPPAAARHMVDKPHHAVIIAYSHLAQRLQQVTRVLFSHSFSSR